MKIEKTFIQDLFIINPKVFKDKRGHFLESFNEDVFNKINQTRFIQDNESFSRKGILRGLHFQKPPFTQSKLVRVSYGEVQDVVVDLRKESETFGKSFSIILNHKNNKQLFVPKGFAHGFLGLDKENIVLYSCSNYRASKYERNIKWNDEDLNINWGIKKPILSKRDKNAQNFNDFVKKK